MFDTMRAMNGVGLAAPQIGVAKRVMILGFEENPRYPDEEPVPETVLINPDFTVLGDDIDEDWEGCLSVPGMRGLVNRYTHIKYTGYDQGGQWIERTVSGFHARVFQHEFDHLNGVLYPMRISDLRKFGYEDALFPDDGAL